MPTLYNGLNHSINQVVFFNDPVLTGPITIAADGLVSEANVAPAMMLNGGAYRLGVYGLLSSTAAFGRGLELGTAVAANQKSVVAIARGGEIHGTDYAITSFHAATITNNGTLSGASGIYAVDALISYTITNRGTISALAANAAIWTDGGGTHTISNSGTITGRIEGSFTSDSIESITNTGTLNGQIWARGGNDVISNAGRINDHVFLDGGDDNLVNTGTITGDINGWDGADTIQNDGTLTGNLLSGTGNDVLNNSGTINGTVDAWEGNDSFTNTGTVNGWIFMGTGNDSFTGGVTREMVADEAGRDIYSFGDGIDNFDAVGTGSASGVDSLNGGDQTGRDIAQGIYGDEYNASDATQAVFINLNNTVGTDVVTGLTYQILRATGTETGTDVLRGFETVYVGAGNDVVFGNASANYINGGAGADHLFGGNGNDHLFGNTGRDSLMGGAGGDILDGGLDAVRDTIIYTALTESAAGGTGRDRLQNVMTQDRIDFTRVSTVDVHYIGTQVAFDGSLGALRVMSTSDGWLIQVDTDGNNVANFAISVLDADHTNVTDWSTSFLV